MSPVPASAITIADGEITIDAERLAPKLGLSADALREAIEQQIPNSRAAVNGGGGGHFSIEVTSPAFAGRSMIESQWLVYGAIAHLMEGDASLVHAVDSLKTRTPSPPLLLETPLLASNRM